MFTTLLLSLVLGVADDTSKERPPHPLAPSLPLLTKQEDARIDAIINRFIESDIGKINEPLLKKTTADLNKLGPESIFNLIEAFNRVANLEASCPAVVIGRKISIILGGSQDVELLTFAKENIGAGVTAKRHLGVVKDLQVGCMLRKTAVLRQQALAAKTGPVTFPAGGLKAPAAMTIPELTKAVEKAKGPQLTMILAEAQKRQSPPLLKGLLKHERADVRAATARVIGEKELRYGAELIERLSDVDPAVQQAARQALVRLAGGVDHGPEPGADSSAREAALARWRQWWEAQPVR